MYLYLLFKLLTGVASAIFGTIILTRDSRHRTNRLSAALLYGCCFWACCEVLWTVSEDAATALALIKLSLLGSAAVGPLTLQLFVEVTSRPRPLLRKALPVLYGLSALFLGLAWLTPWFHSGVVGVPWGWGYQVGPAFLAFYLFTLVVALTAVGVGYHAYRHSPLPAERKQARLIGAGLFLSMSIGFLTDGVLPTLGVEFPNLGSSALCVFGGSVAWSVYHFGYSVLAPGAFAREIFEAMREGLVVLHPDGRIRSANQGMAALTGISRSELATRSIAELLTAPLEDPTRQVFDVDCELIPASGIRFPVSISAILLRDRQQLETGLAVVVRDLREIVTLRQRLLVSGRMAAVGQLAAGVAHEINNPMAYVHSNLGLLRNHWETVVSDGGCDLPEKERRELLDEGMELIDESLEGVHRTISIVADIKNFSHSASPGREQADLNLLIESVLRVVSPRIPDPIRIECSTGKIPNIYCAPREIQQVFVNLVINAADAIDGEGVIRISSRLVGADVEICVADDGCGIDREALERIFDPFFTTKAVGKGTGLGLALSYEIVRRHGGDISVTSRLGEGASFCVSLPLEARSHRLSKG